MEWIQIDDVLSGNPESFDPRHILAVILLFYNSIILSLDILYKQRWMFLYVRE